MYLKASVGLFLACLICGCSVFKKDIKMPSDTVASVETDSTLLAETSLPDTSIIAVDTIVPPPPPKQPLEYMTIEEKAMIEEINLLRADPNAYIQYVDAYIQEFMQDPNWDYNAKQAERNAGEELIRALRYMPPLELLAPSEELYRVAMKHGKDMKENEMISHQGSDGSFPENRIQDSTSLVGSENLAAGGRSVRESVIMLLVDANDRAARSHRKTILNPNWRYVACYYAGTVAEVPGAWVQLFAYKDPNDIPRETPVRSLPDTDDDDLTAGTDMTAGMETTPGTSMTKPEPKPEARPEPKTEAKPEPSKESPTENTAATGDFSFMSTDEKAMIDEVNLMRGNPAGYIKHVDNYVKEMKEVMIGGDPDFDKASNELKDLLRTMPKLSILEPHKKLYEVTKAHGLDNKKNHQLEHKGSDNRQSFDRVKDAGLQNSINSRGEYAPNENLVGGEATVRNSVIALLIDAGIASRGHRKALIEPSWEYIACYKIGTIEDLKDLQGMGLENDDMANCWVQFFAKG